MHVDCRKTIENQNRNPAVVPTSSKFSARHKKTCDLSQVFLLIDFLVFIRFYMARFTFFRAAAFFVSFAGRR